MPQNFPLKPSLWQSFFLFAQDIKLSHSIFALPFAACGLLFAASQMPSLLTSLKLVSCMVFARSFAMGMNRIIDRKIDAKNTRTSERLIPAGKLAVSHSLAWTLICGLIFLALCQSLNDLTGLLAGPLLGVLAFYSYMKRVSWLTHWYLGICLGFAPVAVCIALNGSVESSVIFLGVAVAFWTAGFDIIYATQDYRFDQEHDLNSVPARYGIRKSVRISKVCFVAMVISLCYAGYLNRSGAIYYAGVALVGTLLTIEHWLIRDLSKNEKSSKLNTAFFTINGWVSVVFYLFVQIDWIF